MRLRSHRRAVLRQQIKVKAGVDPNAPRTVEQCTGKRFRFDTKRTAIQAAARATRRHGQTFYQYRCRLCGRFHLSTRPPEDFKFRKSAPLEYNGRIGRTWEPESVDDVVIESFVDQVWALVGLSTVEYAPEIG